MLKMLTTFAALSMAGTVILSLLPEGGLKSTAGMAVGLLSLLCWAEGISELLGFDLAVSLPSTILAPTSVSMQQAEAEAAAALSALWEAGQ